MFEGGTSGIFMLIVKSDIPGCNWPFLTIFDFAIIFHLKKLFTWCHYFQHKLTCVTEQLFIYLFISFILTYCINTMDLKSQKKTNKKTKQNNGTEQICWQNPIPARAATGINPLRYDGK